jgi:hypothetical protein
VSDPYQQQQQFNTGLPAHSFTQPTPTPYAQPPAAQGGYGQSAYGAAAAAPPPATYGGGVYSTAPEPIPVPPAVPTFPPVPESSVQSPPASGNPLLRRGRAVDPSIAAPGGVGGYGGGYGGGASYGGYSGGFVQPEPQAMPAMYGGGGGGPAIFTPEPAGAGGMMPGHGKRRSV